MMRRTLRGFLFPLNLRFPRFHTGTVLAFFGDYDQPLPRNGVVLLVVPRPLLLLSFAKIVLVAVPTPNFGRNVEPRKAWALPAWRSRNRQRHILKRDTAAVVAEVNVETKTQVTVVLAKSLVRHSNAPINSSALRRLFDIL